MAQMKSISGVSAGLSRSAVLVLAAGLALTTLSACDHKKDKGSASNMPPATVAPLGYAKTDPDAQVSLTLPDPIKLYPELHTRLFNAGKQTLTDFIASAHKDRAEQSADGIEVPAYYHAINWKISAQSSRFLSLYAEEDDFQGGAHPNSTFQALLWDKSANDLINTGKIFATGADLSNVDTFVCKQIEAERSKRAGQPVSQANDGLECPKIADSRLILIPSTVTGKIGAVDALFAPSEVAPYAEGPYEVRIPQQQLQGLIAPEFADQFAGDAVKDVALPDPDSSNDKAP